VTYRMSLYMANETSFTLTYRMSQTYSWYDDVTYVV
jgi:hypothetical protein